jgi:hypothetical protein
VIGSLMPDKELNGQLSFRVQRAPERGISLVGRTAERFLPLVGMTLPVIS